MSYTFPVQERLVHVILRKFISLLSTGICYKQLHFRSLYAGKHYAVLHYYRLIIRLAKSVACLFLISMCLLHVHAHVEYTDYML